MTAILEKARAEGYAAGIAQARQDYADMNTMERDDEFYRGQCDAWADAPSRLRWWIFGVICGLLIWSLI